MTDVWSMAITQGPLPSRAWLVRENKEIMAHDYECWQENGLFESFEKFIGLSTEKVSYDSQMHEAWIKKMISEAKNNSGVKEKDRKKPSGAASAAWQYANFSQVASDKSREKI